MSLVYYAKILAYYAKIILAVPSDHAYSDKHGLNTAQAVLIKEEM